MIRTRIKICGVTRAQDALVAAQLGADAIGMIFHAHSPRNIPLDRAREIIAALPPFVTPVGVFVNASAQMIHQTAADLELRAVQLNGREEPELVRSLEPLQAIKAIRVTAALADELGEWRDADVSNLAGVVLEPGHTDHPGGTGVANDWQRIRGCIDAGAFEGLPPIIAAGGLTAESVADVIRLIQPYAVDVSSGVEESKGIKSPAKLRAFIQAVREQR